MKTALLLNAVDDTLGGVLIRGHQGTAKSTTVRALAHLLPEVAVVADCPYHCDPADPVHEECRTSKERTTMRMPVVDLPQNATEDRVVGTLHIEHALQTGERRFEPGLLAAAHRGILYVDEVNLLEDHLVDVLLDAAASGVNIVEREGISERHPARFLLVGTMNPSEGDLRPQFLDRFALCVDVAGIDDRAEREAIVLRRLAFEDDPAAFLRQWQEAQETLATAIIAARRQLNTIPLSPETVQTAVQLGLVTGARGHRADITLVKAARALAALKTKGTVEPDDVLQVARFVLPHRMESAPLDTPKDQQKRIQEAIDRVLEEERPVAEINDEDLDELAEAMQVPGSAAAGSILLSTPAEKKSLEPT